MFFLPQSNIDLTVKEDNARQAATEIKWAEEEAARQAESKRTYEASLQR